MTPLEEVLSGRELRAAEQRRLLAGREDLFLTQVTLNIPGYPKEVEYDAAVVESVCRRLQETDGMRAASCDIFRNGAGVCGLLVFQGDPEKARRCKLAALELEEEADCGKILDIDVITVNGAVTRASLGRPPRRCLLCGSEAKICAASGAHDLAALRAVAVSLTRAYAAAHQLVK